MKSIHHKTYPYPVLSPTPRDYPHATMEATIEPIVKPSGEVDITLDVHGVPDQLRAMIDKKEACYGLELFCEATWTRSLFRLFQSPATCVCPPWHITGAIEAHPFIISLRDGRAITYPHTHEEFADRAFTRKKGDILAWGQPVRAIITHRRQTQKPSLFHMVASDDVTAGMFHIDVTGDSIAIKLHEDDITACHTLMRQGKHTAWLLSSLYLSAVVETLYHMRHTGATHRHKWWYHIIHHAMTRKKLTLANNESLLDIAQQLLTEPSGQPPLGCALSRHTP
ncbi:MAG: hypothetical protein GDA54_06150 [Alphaproteobacteria bacterium GM7ARS4]|nr:hypothetical protein [Alphaproteobacteria bacterium GM7ARS4]